MGRERVMLPLQSFCLCANAQMQFTLECVAMETEHMQLNWEFVSQNGFCLNQAAWTRFENLLKPHDSAAMETITDLVSVSE
jgi:hypothetical protein